QNPLVDMRLLDGAHLTAAVPPLAVRGPCLTVRKVRRTSRTLEDLVASGTLSPQIAEFLSLCLKHRRNVVVAGGTRSGRTTLLAALARAIPDAERVITIEEVAELDLGRDQWIALETRPPDASGHGAVTIGALLHSALRMRPDRLVIGDLVGGDTLDVLSAGGAHDGMLATVRAESPREATQRLESMARQSGVDLGGKALGGLIASAVHVVVQLSRFHDGSRHVVSVDEVVAGERGSELRELYRFEGQGTGEDGRMKGRYVATGTTPRFVEELEKRGEKVPATLFR
ncbi:MAG TPA: ATPase, T2SS/T4P/T4SS family, partial [Gemmatimonadales bacterium]|nr:ATPase, T2SS/T4P/T4SS family [Gemmatimonadales bacterium]